MTEAIRRACRPLLFLLALALSACGGGGGDAAPGGNGPQTPDAAGGQVVESTIRSERAGGTYAIQVFLPASYAAGTATLPAIYVTEGDAPYGATGGGSGYNSGTQSRFNVFKQAMQRRGTQAILVGISGTARRDTDFLLPGASGYLAFISQELAPSVERQYRADPKRRALSGLSHGGYFVVAALVLEAQAGTPPAFSHYLSTDSSFGAHGTPAAFLAFERQIDGKPVPATLFLAGAKAFNGPLVNSLYAQMLSHAHPGLTLLKAEYDTSHVGSDLPAFEEALTRFFP